MAKNGIRDILVHVAVKEAGAKRRCYHSRGKHFIAKGEFCLVIRNNGSLGSKNYCQQCAAPILQLARERIVEVEASL